MSSSMQVFEGRPALTRYENARRWLAEAHRVDEVKDLRDKAEAMAAYARQAKDTELIQYATEIKVRAERRCGELLRSTAATSERATQGRPPKTSNDTTFSTLADMGLTRDESSRYQRLAAMPEEHFETAVATAKSQVGQVTTAAMLRYAEALKEAEGVRQMEERIRREKPWRVLISDLENLADDVERAARDGALDNLFSGWHQQFAAGLDRLNAAARRLMEKANEHRSD